MIASIYVVILFILGVQSPEIFQRMNHCQIQVKIIFEGGGQNIEIIIFNFYKMFQKAFYQFFKQNRSENPYCIRGLLEKYPTVFFYANT